MQYRSIAFKACALLCAALSAGLAQATSRVLDDAQLSAVRGADGSILVGIQPSSSADSHNPFAAGMGAAFASSTGPTLLSPAQFATALQAVGATPSMFADYAGQPVAQIVVDARPVSFSFDFSDALQATTGLSYNTGAGAPSLGMFTLKDFDARGTTVWVWHH